jgi:hypothetical protein
LAALAAEVGLLDSPEDKAAAAEGEKKPEDAAAVAAAEPSPATPAPEAAAEPAAQPAAETPVVAEPEKKLPDLEEKKSEEAEKKSESAESNPEPEQKKPEEPEEAAKVPEVVKTIIKDEPMDVDLPKDDEAKAEEAKQDLVDDPLATLASAAVSTANGLTKTEPESKEDEPSQLKPVSLSPVKKEIIWYDVCLTKSTSSLVQNYGLPDDDSKFQYDEQTKEVVNFTISGKKHELLPGTAYKFRVSAVNSCGQGTWSEVNSISTYLIFLGCAKSLPEKKPSALKHENCSNLKPF